MQQFIKRMRFRHGTKPTNCEHMIHELKYDGIFSAITINKENTYIQGSKNPNITHRYPELADLFECIDEGVKEVVILPEITVFHKGKPSFDLSLVRESCSKPILIDYNSRKYPVTAMVYDILRIDEKWLLNEPLRERKRLLSETIIPNKFVKLSPSSHDGIRMFEFAEKNELEGTVGKYLNSKYLPGSITDAWLKYKCWKESVIEIDGYEINPAGATLTNKEGIRVQCAGFQHREVINLIDKKKIIKINIQYLEETCTGKFRKISYRGIA